MPAPRKPASEKHINRWMSFRPEISAYLDSLPAGQKSAAINEAIKQSPGYQKWQRKNK